MSTCRRLARGVAVVALVWVSSAAAHETDPRVTTVVDSVAPALPAGVTVTTRIGIAEELVAENATPTPLEILGEDGRPFLRISTAGVEANLAERDWYRSNSAYDTATIPLAAYPGAAPRWRKVSTGSDWVWFDHRLHPDPITTVDPTTTTRAGEWEIAVRYGGRRSLIRGHREVGPVLGVFSVTADAAPHGLAVTALAGRLPGLFLTDPAGLPVVVFGSDGKPFLRLGPHGAEVDEGSPSWAEDLRSRGEQVPLVASRPRWRKLAATPTMSWLDPRLSYGAPAPPDPTRAADLRRWEVPMTVQGRAASLTGLIRWVPAESAVAASRDGGGARDVFVGAGVALLLVAAGAAVSGVRQLRHRVRA